jgi:hypothetical protein
MARHFSDARGRRKPQDRRSPDEGPENSLISLYEAWKEYILLL